MNLTDRMRVSQAPAGSPVVSTPDPPSQNPRRPLRDPHVGPLRTRPCSTDHRDQREQTNERDHHHPDREPDR